MEPDHFVHGAAATPTPLLEALAGAPTSRTSRSTTSTPRGRAPSRARARGPLPLGVALHRRAAARAVAEGRADFIPVFLSDIPGSSVERAHPARRRAGAALAARPPRRLHARHLRRHRPGRGRHARSWSPRSTSRCRARTALVRAAVSRIDAFITTDRPLPSTPPPSDRSRRASASSSPDLVEDGSTLQMGIGAIPDAVLSRLGTTSTTSACTPRCSPTGSCRLVEGGVVTNRRKKPCTRAARSPASSPARKRSSTSSTTTAGRVPPLRPHQRHRAHPPRTSASWPSTPPRGRPHRPGLRRLHRPPHLLGHRRPDGLHPRRGALLPRRQADHRAPLHRRGGKLSRIVPTLKPGAGVVTTRGHVHWVVTEYGAVNLHGKTLRERGEALISIAHPDFRAELTSRSRSMSRSVTIAPSTRISTAPRPSGSASASGSARTSSSSASPRVRPASS
jgi:4-hydroxybutyrate CoA-transferase